MAACSITSQTQAHSLLARPSSGGESDSGDYIELIYVTLRIPQLHSFSWLVSLSSTSGLVRTASSFLPASSKGMDGHIFLWNDAMVQRRATSRAILI